MSKNTASTHDTLRELFDSLSFCSNGRISSHDLYQAAEKFGYRLSDKQLEVIKKRTDGGVNPNEPSINFEEFVIALLDNKVDISAEEHRTADVRRKFSEYDSDGSGSVSADEAHEILEKELAFSARQSEELVRRYDVNGDGQLSFEEFVRFYSKVKDKVDEMRRLFAEFDRDGSGSVSTEEAKVMLQRYGLSEDQVEELIAKYDVDHDGELQYTEFAAFLMDF